MVAKLFDVLQQKTFNFAVVILSIFALSIHHVRAAEHPSGPAKSISLYGPAEKGDGFKHYEHVNPNAPKGGTVILPAFGSFDSLNPFVIKGTPARGLIHLYPYFFYITLMDQSNNEPFSQYCLLAETVDYAADRKSIAYKIRRDATFHDGSPITIDDVIFSFNTLIAKGLPFYKKYFADVTRVERVDDFTVRFHFKDDTNKELHMLLGTFPILSKTFYEKNEFKASLKIPLGNGPYRIKSVDPGRSIEYERVKNWWGEKIPVNVGRYNFDNIRYIYFRDPDVSFEAFKSHDYDIRIENEIKKWMTGYDKETIASGEMKRIVSDNVQAGTMNGLVMNMRRDKFKDRKVREALILAFDFEWLNDNYFYNQYHRTTSYFWGLDLASSGRITAEEKAVLEPFVDQLYPEVLSEVYKVPVTDGSGRDRKYLRQAKQILKDAGYILKDGKLYDPKTNEPFEIEILLPQQTYTRLLGAYIKRLKRLGIQARFRIVDTSQYTARVEDYDFDMIPSVFYQSNSPGNEQREFWGSRAAQQKGTQNLSGLKNPVVDHVIELLIDAQDRETLKLYAKVLDRLLLWEHMLVPLWGAIEVRVAHWDRTVKGQRRLKHTGNFSKYNFDLASWWTEEVPS